MSYTIHDELEDMSDWEESRCLSCGQFIDYCLGHGADEKVDALYEDHEYGNHAACNPLACDDAPVLTD